VISKREPKRLLQVRPEALCLKNVDSQRIPRQITVKRSLDPSLDQSAIEAVKEWRFEPGKDHGGPVNMVMSVEVEYKP